MKKVMNMFDMDISHAASWKEAGLECGIRDDNKQHLIEPPSNVKWVHKQESFKEDGDNTGITVITDYFLNPNFIDFVSSLDCSHKIGLTIESPIVHPDVYRDLPLWEDHLDFIFTFDKRLLEKNPSKYKFMLADQICIETESHKVHDKSKMVSMMYSHSNVLSGDRPMREQVSSAFSDKIDVFGHGSPKGEEPMKSKTLNDYMFSVVMENCVSDYYYTEKILDCFITGTIPIFRGTDGISEFFDTRGIIQWNTLQELENILDNLSSKLYKEMLPFAKKNFEIAHKYISPDDVLYDLIQECLDDSNYDTKRKFIL